MPILSIEFSIFFIAFFALYWSCRPSLVIQNRLLLIASIGWLIYLNWQFAASVILYGAVVQCFAHLIANATTDRQAKIWLSFGVISTLLGLFGFKYYDFYRPFFRYLNDDSLIDILLPLGISYYTFQSISYLVDLHRSKGEKLTTPNFLLAISFFPTITAGPIFRIYDSKSMLGNHQGIAAQITQQKPREIIFPALAITLILLGIAKKWWFAGYLDEHWVSSVFNNPLQFDFWYILLAIYGYTLQLFLDFSGYSDLVIGMAMLLGFQLPTNFHMPLHAVNIREFWNRWHISLSTWIRDYIYIPLGGSHYGFFRTQLNLLWAMALSGVWHGYGWNFLIWGCLHGIALIFLNTTDKLFNKRNALSSFAIGKVIGVLVTLHFVCFTFVIFHTHTLEEATSFFSALIEQSQNIGIPDFSSALMLLLLALALFSYSILAEIITGFVNLLDKTPVTVWFIIILCILLVITVFAPSGIPGFIYANF